MKFYTFYQNNSGGSFDFDKEAGIGQVVFIEAESAELANQKAESIGIYFNGVAENKDCECCGDRWYEVDEGDAEDTPLLFGIPAKLASKNYGAHYIFIHYANGDIEYME